MNANQRVFWVTLLAAGWLAGCSSPQFSRIEGSRELYESWPLDVRQAVLDGKVIPSMTGEMVVVSWGEPDEILSRSNGPHQDEIWVYRTTSGGDYIYPTNPMGSSYPGGGISPGYPSSGTGRSGVGIGVGPGGIGIGVGGGGSGGVGIGPSSGGMSSGPIMVRPPVTTEREVVFRDGVVIRADNPNTTPLK